MSVAIAAQASKSTGMPCARDRFTEAMREGRSMAEFEGPGARPGPVELKLASLGPVQPLVVGHYGEMGGYVDELLELAADAGADKH